MDVLHNKLPDLYSSKYAAQKISLHEQEVDLNNEPIQASYQLFHQEVQGSDEQPSALQFYEDSKPPHQNKTKDIHA